MSLPPHEMTFGYHTACEPRGARITEHLVSLLRLFEAFSLYCFRTRTPYFVDSGTLLGCLRHRGVIPWDNDLDLAMLDSDFIPFLESFSQEASGLILERDGYGDPNGCVWFRDERSGPAGLDLSSYEGNGRSLMSLAVQREWPLDAWATRHSEDSWKYDFRVDDLRDFVFLPSFCGPQRAPRTWEHRLARHYDHLDIDPLLREKAAAELPFDPIVAPVQLVPSYATLAEGMSATLGRRPFEVRDATLGREPNSPAGSSAREISPARAEGAFCARGSPHAYHWLTQGEKYWWFVEPNAASVSWLASRSITEILTADGFSRWGRVHVLHHRAGTAVVFPGMWPARVHTFEDSVGTTRHIDLRPLGEHA